MSVRRCILILHILIQAASFAQTETILSAESHTTALLARGGPILPAPQKAIYNDDSWPVEKGDVALILSPQANESIRNSGEELALRIGFLVGDSTGGIDIIHQPQHTGKRLQIFLGSVRELPASFTDAELLNKLPADSRKESYVIRCLPERRWVVCAGFDDLGTWYAAQSVMQLFSRDKEGVQFHPADVTDWPGFAIRSVSAVSWRESPGPESLAEALRTARWMGTCKFNVIAINPPIQDAQAWRKPTDYYVQYVTWITPWAISRGLDVMPLVNPFIGEPDADSPDSSLVISRERDRDQVEAIFRLAVDRGSRRIMVCMGDFSPAPYPPYELVHEEDRRAYNDFPEAAAFLLMDLRDRLKRICPDLQVLWCPPWYCTEMMEKMESTSGDIRRTASLLPEDMLMAWTGPVVRSTYITDGDLSHWNRLTGREQPFLWDNTFYERRRNGVSIGSYYLADPFDTRYPADFEKMAAGVYYNNGFYGEIAHIGLLDRANYLWNPAAYDPVESRRLCVERIAGPGCLEAIDAFREIFYELFTLDATEERGLLQGREALPRLKQCLERLESLTDNMRLAREFRREYETMTAKYGMISDNEGDSGRSEERHRRGR